MNFKVIFIAGVHGVGKGHLCSQMSKVLGVPCFSASQLIRNTKQKAVDDQKCVIDAEENQDYLIEALRNLHVSTDYIILDGHFCLHGGDHVIDVPVGTFENMGLRSIVLLQDAAQSIHDRMLDRDGHALEVSIINSLQNNEIERAKCIAELLRVPLCVSAIHDTEASIRWVGQQIKLETARELDSV